MFKDLCQANPGTSHHVITSYSIHYTKLYENLLLGALLKRIKEQNTLTEFDLMICDWLFMCCNDFSCHFDDLESLICSINNEKDFEKN